MKENIDSYIDLEQYLIQGGQSQLSQSDIDFIESTLKFDTKKPCESIYKWKEEIFFLRNKGIEPYIGENSMSKIIGKKILQGCHDDALIIATVLRKYSIPCTMIETINIEHTQNKESFGYKGHVFLKVYLDGQRKLYDPTHNEFVKQDKQGIIKSGKLQSHFYTIAEGQDSRAYGVHNHQDLHNLMDANKYIVEKIKIKKKISNKIYNLFKQ